MINGPSGLFIFCSTPQPKTETQVIVRCRGGGDRGGSLCYIETKNLQRSDKRTATVTTDRADMVLRLIEEALECPGGKRAAFLKGISSLDPSLRAEVEAGLADKVESAESRIPRESPVTRKSRRRVSMKRRNEVRRSGLQIGRKGRAPTSCSTRSVRAAWVPCTWPSGVTKNSESR